VPQPTVPTLTPELDSGHTDRSVSASPAPALVSRQDGHVDHVEVPATVTDEPPHSHGRTGTVDDTACGPTARQGTLGLFHGARSEAGVLRSRR